MPRRLTSHKREQLDPARRASDRSNRLAHNLNGLSLLVLNLIPLGWRSLAINAQPALPGPVAWGLAAPGSC